MLSLTLMSCKSANERESDRLMPAVDAFCAAVPSTDPKEFVRTALGYADKLKALEAMRDELHPPAGTLAAKKLPPGVQWIEAARAENTALEVAFQRELVGIEQDAHADLTQAMLGGPTKKDTELGAVVAHSSGRPLVLWHGAGKVRCFDEDHQNVPAARRATDPSARFVVGYVQRVDGEGVRFAQGVTAGEKDVFIALYEVPSGLRLGVFSVKGSTAQLPTPMPPPGTLVPGPKPALVESLLSPP